MSYDPQYNPYSLQGKTVLITGASSGIGRATAVECARLGARCVITGRDEPRLQQTLESLPGDGHMYIIADLSTQCGVDKLVETMPNVDGLVNNAGAGIRKPVGFYKQEDLERIFQILNYVQYHLIVHQSFWCLLTYSPLFLHLELNHKVVSHIDR